MSIRQVMEYADELVRNGQLPGRTIDKPLSPPEKGESKKTEKQSEEPKRGFWKRVFGSSRNKMKVYVRIPAQEMQLDHEDGVEFLKTAKNTGLQLEEASIKIGLEED